MRPPRAADKRKGYYIAVFPAIKYFSDNGNLIKLARRILQLSSSYRWSISFWRYLIIGLISPKPLLHWYRFHRINNIKVDYPIKGIANIAAYLKLINRKVQDNQIIGKEDKIKLNRYLSFVS